MMIIYSLRYQALQGVPGCQLHRFLPGRVKMWIKSVKPTQPSVISWLISASAANSAKQLTYSQVKTIQGQSKSLDIFGSYLLANASHCTYTSRRTLGTLRINRTQVAGRESCERSGHFKMQAWNGEERKRRENLHRIRCYPGDLWGQEDQVDPVRKRGHSLSHEFLSDLCSGLHLSTMCDSWLLAASWQWLC